VTAYEVLIRHWGIAIAWPLLVFGCLASWIFPSLGWPWCLVIAVAAGGFAGNLLYRFFHWSEPWAKRP
jgi:hypothetical protein